MAKTFDANLNLLMDGYPDDWARFLCARVGVPTGRVEVLDTDLANTVQADKLFRIHGPVPAVVHVELESTGHLGRPVEVLRYNVLSHVLTGLPVHSVVILLRPKANSSDLTGEHVITRANGRRYLIFEYEVIRVWEESIDTLLAAGIGLAPLSVLTDESARDLDRASARLSDRLQSAGVPANLKRELGYSAFLLGGLRYEAEQLEVLRRSLSMKNILEDSLSYQMIVREAQERGEKLGGAKVGQEILLRLGRARCGPTTAATEVAVRGIKDIERLERLADRVLVATTWDDLLATP